MSSPLLYYSTNLKAEKVTFSQALLKGIAPDGGLYMPERIPQFSPAELASLAALSYPELAFVVLSKYLIGEIPAEKLKSICFDAYNFKVPLERVLDRKYILRLDRGPTASFKDFAARMMARLMDFYLDRQQQKMVILTATSGDTGSAIANAFYGLDHIEVAILFPKDEVTPRQRKQMTTLDKNVHTISVDGKFDDCQAMVKRAFADPTLAGLNLSSANSINIGRLLPQSVYYFYAWSRLAEADEPVIFSVPSGNFGDMMGGLLAREMGLPVIKFVIATNANKEFPEYLKTGEYRLIVPSINCISSAMNVGHPSNMSRLFALYGGVMNEKGDILTPPDLEKMRRELYSTSVSDEVTEATIKEAYEKYGVLLEPHGAVGWKGLERCLRDIPELDNTGQLCVSLETAHPAKFPEHITDILGIEPKLPPSLAGLDDRPEFVTNCNDYESFREILLDSYS